MMNKSLLTLFLLCFSLLLSAQVENFGRFEVEHDWNNQDYVVISNDERGAILVQPEIESGLKEYPIVFHHLDKDLSLKWRDTLTVKRQLFLRGYHHVGAKTFLLFQNTSLAKEIKLVVINLDSREMVAYEPKSIVDLDIQEFEVLKNTAIIGGYIEERPAVFAYDLDNQKVRTLSNVYQNNSELVEVRINSDSVTFNVLASKLDPKKDRIIIVNTYDYGGNAVRGYELITDKDHNLLSGVSSSIFEKEQIVTGLYSIKSGTFPSGIYINHVDRTGRQNMRYINFGQFETFLDHNGEKRSERLKRKALESIKSDKEWRYKTDALFNEFTETDEHLILFGEFFKPWSMTTQNYLRNRGGLDPYRNNLNYNGYNSINTPGISNNTFKGPNEWDFTHAFALKIDKKGNIIWDRSFEIDEEKDGMLNKFGAFQLSGEDAYYGYYHNEELIVKHLNNSSAKPSIDEVELLKEGEKVRYEKEGYEGIVPWYNNLFLVYGLQTIKGETSDDNRQVFFINAVKALPSKKEDIH